MRQVQLQHVLNSLSEVTNKSIETTPPHFSLRRVNIEKDVQFLAQLLSAQDENSEQRLVVLVLFKNVSNVLFQADI